MEQELILGIEEKPAIFKGILWGFQHLLAAFAGTIAVPLIVGNAIGIPVDVMSFYVSCTLFAAGVATIIQTLGIWKIGAKIPCLMGTDFTFVNPAIIIGKKFGLPGIFFATIVGSSVEIIASFFIRPLKKLFPPLVTGIVVFLIGITLIPVSIDWLAGVGTPEYGSPLYLTIGSGVLIIIIILNQFFKGIVSSASILIGIIIGYLVSYFAGIIDFTPVKEAQVFNFLLPLKWGLKPVSFMYLFLFFIAYIVTTIETVGDIYAIGTVCNKKIEPETLKRGILADGVGSLIGGLFNTGPNTSYSQNVGLIPLSRIGSRYVVAIAGFIFVLLALFPKIGALIAIMPLPVLGGAGIAMFGMVAAGGIKILQKVEMSQRNMLIFAIATGIGVGVTIKPQILNAFPTILKTLFSSGIVVGTIIAVILNIILPQKQKKSI